jgi:chorismate mutase / prephenate dehydratase
MSGTRTLAAVRHDIDAIDEAIHELIRQRTELVEEVRRLKQDWRVKIQPAREAEILYRLVDQHRGPFPKQELIAIWRTLIVATLSFEGPFSVAVHVPGDNEGVWDLARDHFGGYVPMATETSAEAVIDDVDAQRATVGVLPAFAPADAHPWWLTLGQRYPTGPRIVARLPFAGPGNARPTPGGAFVICPVAVLASGRDRAFVVVSALDEPAVERLGAALASAGLRGDIVAASSPDADESARRHVLVETDGVTPDDDPRLARLAAELGDGVRVTPIGGYAEPFSAEELAPAPRAEAAAPQPAVGVPSL